MEYGNDKLLKLLEQSGYPAFKLDLYGFPLPGQVVKYFREQMKYPGNDGKEKHWTQADLAKRLGLKEWAVRIMETKGKGLDSIDRRRTLATLLKIPPILLGLGSLDSLHTFLESKDIKVSSVLNSNAKIGSEQIDLYSSAFQVYNIQHAQMSMANSVQIIEQWITRIYSDVQIANSNIKIPLLQVLYDFHVLASKIQGMDLFNWNAAFNHVNRSIELATMLKSPELSMMSLYLSGDFHLVSHKPILAMKDFNNALLYKDGASQQTIGAIYASLALATAMQSSDKVADSLKLLDKAEPCTSGPNTNVGLLYHTGRYLLDRSDVLILAKHYKTALTTLDDAEYELGSNETRRLEYLNILRAECYLKKTKPEYEHVVSLITNVLNDNTHKQHAYHIQYVSRLYNLLQDSSYSNAPDVADLGLMLQELQGMNN